MFFVSFVRIEDSEFGEIRGISERSIEINDENLELIEIEGMPNIPDVEKIEFVPKVDIINKKIVYLPTDKLNNILLENQQLREQQNLMQKALDDLIFGGGL